MNARTVQLILENLESKGIAESKTRGKIKSYKLKMNDLTKMYLTFTEQYKSISYLEENLLLKEIIEKINPLIEGIGIIFGSYANHTNKEDSDLDVFVAGECDTKEVSRISKIYGVDISIKCYPMKTFDKKIQKDVLIKEVLKNHIVFKNAEMLIEKVITNG
ncbi:MAG: nucleotidyltransferase domain-containing protein [Candidatus Delongbacteria bacterium]|nr:nucleotidyltransferase domain-containing protein [Candidatus Delongbacteria bacterium]